MAKAIRIQSSSIEDNVATGNGGGLLIVLGSDASQKATVINSTISGNSAANDAAIYSAKDLDIIASTIAGNHAEGANGGVAIRSTVWIKIDRSIVAGNTSGPNDTPSDLYDEGNLPIALSGSHNLILAPSAPLSPSVAISIPPKLGALASNGGPTRTQCPLAGSPAIGAGSTESNPFPTDQRGPGYPRSSGGKIDIGACEYDEIFPSTFEPLPY